MDFWELVLTGVIAGWLAGQFMTGKGFGVVSDLIAGVIGSLIGGALFETSGIFTGIGFMGSMTVATAGAVVIPYALRMVKKA